MHGSEIADRFRARAVHLLKDDSFRINHLSKWIHGKQSPELNQVQLHKNGYKDDIVDCINEWKMTTSRDGAEVTTKMKNGKTIRSYCNRTQFKRKMNYLR